VLHKRAHFCRESDAELCGRLSSILAAGMGSPCERRSLNRVNAVTQTDVQKNLWVRGAGETGEVRILLGEHLGQPYGVEDSDGANFLLTQVGEDVRHAAWQPDQGLRSRFVALASDLHGENPADDVDRFVLVGVDVPAGSGRAR
jgi:hypothetical protein